MLTLAPGGHTKQLPCYASKLNYYNNLFAGHGTLGFICLGFYASEKCVHYWSNLTVHFIYDYKANNLTYPNVTYLNLA